MRLDAFERTPLTFGPSPVHRLERLTAHLGGAQLWAKRDDVNSGLAFGGNKTRKLEYLIPDALAQGADTLVSIGGVQSNQTRQVAAVAAHLGMKCVLVQENWVNYSDAVYDRVGNIQMSRIMGADVRLVGESPLALLDGLYVGTTSASSTASSTSSSTSTSSSLSPLSSIATAAVGAAPLTIQRQAQFPYADVSFNLADGVTLGTAIDRIEAIEAKLKPPASVQMNFEGAAQLYSTSLGNEALLLVGALIAVYILLGILYESLIHPLTILSTLPSAACGALAALLFCGGELDIIGLIGIVLLVGIVMKNAIMMVDFAIEATRHGAKTSRDAIEEACLLRFRPIMMTTAAALLGALPLAFGTGEGSEMRAPLGIAIVGGLIVSQMLTLYTTPVVYLYMDRIRVRGEARRARRKDGASPASAVE